MWWEGMAAVISRLQRDKHPPHQAAGSQSTFAKRRRLMGWSCRWALTSIRTPLMCALTLTTLGVVCFDTCHTLPLCVALNSAGSYFFPSYSWMMRQNVGDTASCWESALPLHCRHFRRESVSPSAYIYIYIFILYLYTLKWNVHFRETNCWEKNRHSVLMEEDCCRKQEKAGLWRG